MFGTDKGKGIEMSNIKKQTENEFIHDLLELVRWIGKLAYAVGRVQRGRIYKLMGDGFSSPCLSFLTSLVVRCNYSLSEV